MQHLILKRIGDAGVAACGSKSDSDACIGPWCVLFAPAITTGASYKTNATKNTNQTKTNQTKPKHKTQNTKQNIPSCPNPFLQGRRVQPQTNAGRVHRRRCYLTPRNKTLNP